ncbi:MAG: ABC transporter substrate-binding protein [Caldilineaceae bacterium]|uniref:ABC transporter substrate-binding protein n=1 Tax=Caldilineaceae bacterium SB0664_bin_27 TaxID=2605260 RepID=A0A6B0YXJ4_9CHLR|nr:ABC transporter substrate-binding protein [Caldilineaceae bacterium]MDE0336517.1 ABC transporter substrate-binding protein [Caldilineaceae bacterium]MXY95824.1 ABC transporter substrate-binding protein [Caldilineaceae bacterium SB0664_bin_27]
MRRVARTPISRREFMRVSGVAAAGAVAVACGASGEPEAMEEAAPAEDSAAESSEAAPAASSSQYSEAPMLADMVAAGDLPPVDERLPVNPMVMPVAEENGNYGGTFRRGFKGVSDRWGPTKMQDRGLSWYDQNLNMQPRMAESWEINEDASEWTFHLREGMKWSDGTPFTTEAIRWWWEEDETNTTISPSIGGTWVSGAERTPMELEIVDDSTVTFKFPLPNPLYVFRLGRQTRNLYLPGHYLKQFHMDLTDDQDKLQAQVEEAGFNSWEEYYTDRRWWYLNPDLPSIGPWISKNELSNELFLMERNPYFFGVDSDGRQLPYVDDVTHRLFETNDVFDLRIINGEIDFQARHVNIGNFTLYKENEEAGDYQVFLGSASGHSAIQLNLSTKNERLAEFFNIRDVRIALSVAVDRVALNELVWDGLMTPRQYSPLESSAQAYPKQANAWIEYDPDTANQLLDDAGYAEKDSDGFRLFNDGSGDTLSFVIEGTAQPGTTSEDTVQEVIKYFAAVGVKAAYKGFERSLYEEHHGANEIEAAWWGGDRTVVPLVNPTIWTCEQPDRPWAAGWAHWRNSGGTSPAGVEPPAGHWVWTIWEIWDAIKIEPDPDKQTAMFHQILDIWAEELPMIGYLGERPAPIIVKNGVRNYLPGFPLDDTTGDEHLLHTETYFWEDADSMST